VTWSSNHTLESKVIDHLLWEGKEMDWLRRKGEERAQAKSDREAAQAEAERVRQEQDRQQAEAHRAYMAEVVEDYGLVKFTRDGSVQWQVSTTAEAKLAIKQLRLKKKELTAQKREIAADVSAVRAEYRTKAAGRLYMGRGGGTAGQMIRAGVRAKRRSERMAVEDSVVPLEQQKAQLDARMLVIDRAIAQIETDELQRDA
jgi:hypothetical protein